MILILLDLMTNALVIQIEGNFVPVFGTSAATPVVASMLSMINDARLSIGKRPIGFINPTVCGFSFVSILKV